KVERPEDVVPAWDRALTADGPVLLEFVTDPKVAALPPHVKPSMFKKVVKGLAKGDEDAVGIAETGFTGKVIEFAEKAKERLGDAGLPPIQVSALQGKLLRLLVRSIDARRVLEFGALAGYSAIWMAGGLAEGGRLTTLELDPRHADVARANIAAAGLADVVDV